MPVHLMPRYARRMVPVVVVTAGLTSVLAGALAAPAMADTSSIAVASTTVTPEQAFPVDLNFSGTNALTGAAEVEAIVRPAGGPACQTSYQEDTSTFAGQDTTILAPGAQTVAPGPYQVSASFRPPAAGSYQLCAWLAQNQNSTDQPVASPAMLSIAARAPQVSQLTVTVPKDLQPNVSFDVSYTTQTDQQLSLYSVMYPAADGACTASFEANQGQSKIETVLSGFFSPQVFGGPVTTTAAAKQKTGLYQLCTWVEGPSSGEVDDSASTTVTVGNPVPPAPPSPKLKLTKATASHRHGVTIAGTTVSGFTGKLVVSAACGSATTRHTTTARRGRFASSMRLPSGCRTARASTSSSPSHGQAPAPSPSRRCPGRSRSPGDSGGLTDPPGAMEPGHDARAPWPRRAHQRTECHHQPPHQNAPSKCSSETSRPPASTITPMASKRMTSA